MSSRGRKWTLCSTSCWSCLSHQGAGPGGGTAGPVLAVGALPLSSPGCYCTGYKEVNEISESNTPSLRPHSELLNETFFIKSDPFLSNSS